MEGKHDMLQYRERLDKTLASHDLANEEILKTLVKNQILHSSKCEIEEYIDNVVENRTKEVSNLIGMLRSASMGDDEGSKSSEAPHGGWKIKQDTQEHRVMYREGPQGTPFHTLLVEGYLNGPIDVCLCISMESDLYKKWWPQSSIPTFKVVSSECLQKVRIGEQISLVRMKLSWPLSAREIIVHYFTFEYFQDELVIVLLKSISDLESIDRSTHGFTKDGIPDAQEVVRIDLVGGYAIQKVTADRSYFRIIANMDLKLDFAPPALINFVARQLIGGGFKLYQKEVTSVSKGNEDIVKALKDPLYTRIHEALYSDNITNEALEPEDHNNDTCFVPEEHSMKIIPTKMRNMENKVHSDDYATHCTTVMIDNKALGEIVEIEEEEIEENGHMEEDRKDLYKPATDQIVEKFSVGNKKKVVISHEVEKAMGILEKAISMFRENEFNPKTRSLPGLSEDAVKDSKSAEDCQIYSNGGASVEISKNESMEGTSHEPRSSSCSHGSRRMGSNSYAGEAHHNRIAPASPDEEDIPNSNETTEAAVTGNIRNGDKLVNVETNGIKENTSTKRKNKKQRLCCLHFLSDS